MTDRHGDPPRAPRPIAWADGRVMPAAEATVPLLDEGFQRGDAVFETVFVRRGRTHALDPHLARMRASAKELGIRVPVLKQVVADLLAGWGTHDGAMKLIVTRSGTVRGIVEQRAWPPSLSLEPVELPWRTPLSGAKTLSYAANMMAVRRARAAHADDALVVDDGVVHELPTGAIGWFVGDRVQTPDADRLPILRSVTVLELAKIVPIERVVAGIDEVVGADEVFVLSATRPVVGVDAVGETTFDAPGPRTARLAEKFLAHVDATLD